MAITYAVSAVQAALIHDFDERWATSVGARLFAPTGGDTLGTGNGKSCRDLPCAMRCHK